MLGARLLDPSPVKPKGCGGQRIGVSSGSAQPTIQLCCASCWRYPRL